MKLIMKLASIKVLSALVLSFFLSAFLTVNAEIPGEISKLRAEAYKKLQARAYVNNFSSEFPGFLNREERNYLEKKLEQFASLSNGEIAIAIVDDFHGMDANQFSTELFNSWKIGTEGKDNGVLITVKPTQTPPGRSIYISTGYGAESFVTDFKAKQIIENEIKPNFANGKFFAGLDLATDSLIKLMNGGADLEVPDHGKPKPPQNNSGLLELFLIVLLFIFFFGMRSKLSNKRAENELLASSMFLGSTGHHGSGFSGGGFGGGFGGFGGGFSGGGGAGGGW